MFPSGLPGLALALLRISVAATLWIGPWQSNAGGVVWIVGLSLIAGVFTPFTASICGLVHLWLLFEQHTASLFGLAALGFAISLAILGPGAYSIDGFMFARRVVILPPPDSED
jgi:hypothetical protein